MTDYFHELNCQPVEDGQIQTHQMMLMARYLRQSGYGELIYAGFDLDRLSPPASRELVKNLPSRLVTEKDEKCAICLLPNENLIDEKFVKLPCNHEFHDTCILPWLGRTNTCPMCRQEMETDNEEFEEGKKRKQRKKQREVELEMLHHSMFG